MVYYDQSRSRRKGAPRVTSIDTLVDLRRWPSLLFKFGQANWTLADQVVVSGTNFATAVLVARALGIAEFGIFSLTWMVVLFAQSIQIALIVSPMMSIGPKQSADEAPPYYSAVAVQQLLFSVACCLGVTLAALGERALNLGWGIDRLAGALAVCVFFVQIHDFLRRYNYTAHRARVVFISDMVRNGLQLAALFSLLLFGTHVTLAEVLLIITGSAIIGILTFAGNAPLPIARPEQLLRVLRRHFHFSKWLLGSALLQWSTGNFFVIAAGAMLGPIAVGALKAAQSLVAVTHIFFQAADNFMPPRAARVYQTDGVQGLRVFVRRLLLIGGAGTAIVCLAMAIPAQIWLTLLFGKSYADYGFVVAGYAVSYFLLACMTPFRYAFLATERTRPIFNGYILAALFTAAGFYPLIDVFGIYGTIIGIVLCQAIMLGNFTIQFRRLR
jgi:O-antigen/teichoic acid export membrane protein